MLIYHPAYDAYHSLFRQLIVIDSLQSIDLAKLRILDFFLVFPAEIRSIRLPREQMAARKVAEQRVNPYHGPVNSKKTFQDMEQIHVAALRALAASNLIEKDKLDSGLAERSSTELPSDMLDMIALSKKRDPEMIDFILFGLGKMETQGVNGLKDRSGLLEYRYDVA